MYPDRPEMDFDCNCPVRDRKNVWNDISGVHVRYCPICGERREQFYVPTQDWSETGQGLMGKPIPGYLKAAKMAADGLRGTVRNPKAV